MENITTSGQGRPCRPKILWLADSKGWAYDSIVKQIGGQLQQYEHQVYYMMAKHSDVDWVRLGWQMQQADIVVAMHWMYQVQLQNVKSQTVIMLTGNRGLNDG